MGESRGACPLRASQLWAARNLAAPSSCQAHSQSASTTAQKSSQSLSLRMGLRLSLG